MNLLVIPVLILAFAAPPKAGKNNKSSLSLRLHSEGLEREGPSFVIPIDLTVPSKRIFIRKVPIITEKDIKAIFPFTGGDGNLGCTLVLDNSGRERIEEFTTSSRDAIVVALINGRIGAAMKVDRRITDGMVTIPAGFTPEEILILQSRYPTFGKEKEFPTQRKKALASLAKSAAAKEKQEKEQLKKSRAKDMPEPKKKKRKWKAP